MVSDAATPVSPTVTVGGNVEVTPRRTSANAGWTSPTKGPATMAEEHREDAPLDAGRRRCRSTPRRSCVGTAVRADSPRHQPALPCLGPWLAFMSDLVPTGLEYVAMPQTTSELTRPREARRADSTTGRSWVAVLRPGCRRPPRPHSPTDFPARPRGSTAEAGTAQEGVLAASGRGRLNQEVVVGAGAVGRRPAGTPVPGGGGHHHGADGEQGDGQQGGAVEVGAGADQLGRRDLDDLDGHGGDVDGGVVEGGDGGVVVVHRGGRDPVGLGRPARPGELTREAAAVGLAGLEHGADATGAPAVEVAVDVVGEGGDGDRLEAGVGDGHVEGEGATGGGQGGGPGVLDHHDGGGNVGEGDGGVVVVGDLGAVVVAGPDGDDVGLAGPGVADEVAAEAAASTRLRAAGRCRWRWCRCPGWPGCRRRRR